MVNLSKLNMEQRINSLEEIVYFGFLTIASTYLLMSGKIVNFWIELLLLVVFAFSLGSTFTYLAIIGFQIGGRIQKGIIKFYFKYESKLMPVMKLAFIIIAIVISKFLMKINWGYALGILILTIVGNLVSYGFKKKRTT